MTEENQPKILIKPKPQHEDISMPSDIEVSNPSAAEIIVLPELNDT
jgi:hypothetical protein